MATVRYTVANGEVIAEKRGATRSLYVPDPLGSTIALINASQAKTDTWTYWPYGEVKTRTGTTATPFQFVGTQGYYHDSANKSYVRARYLDKQKARWMNVDPIGFQGGDRNLYRYAGSRPISVSDPSGLRLCPKYPRVACFSCWFQYYYSRGSDPLVACQTASSVCHFIPGPQGDQSCDDWVKGLPKQRPLPPPVQCLVGIDPFIEPAPVSGHECVDICNSIYPSHGVGWGVCVGICKVVEGKWCAFMAGYCEGDLNDFKKKVCEYLYYKLCLGPGMEPPGGLPVL
jgi:RHS repeat-associated protein